MGLLLKKRNIMLDKILLHDFFIRYLVVLDITSMNSLRKGGWQKIAAHIINRVYPHEE